MAPEPNAEAPPPFPAKSKVKVFKVKSKKVQWATKNLQWQSKSHQISGKPPSAAASVRNRARSSANLAEDEVGGTSGDGRNPADEARQKRLHDYPIPDDLRKIFAAKETPEVLVRGLSAETYRDFFSTLLYLEDFFMEGLGKGRKLTVALKTDQKSGLIVLAVPGGEGKKGPSPLSRDYVHVQPSNKKDRMYQGDIVRRKRNKLFVRFEEQFWANHRPNLKYDVSFSFNRINIKRGHQAIAEIGVLSNAFLFPCESSRIMRCEKTDNVTPFNPSLNEQQLTAIRQILECHGSPPYIIHGECATGMTVTVVEAILQVLSSNTNARILACAPFNRDSDLLLRKLLGSMEEIHIFRLNALYRKGVPGDILPFCLCKAGVFGCPPLEKLLEYKVIISTYMSAARLHAQGLYAGHFTHIFLDKSGDGSEPETMVPIAKLATTETVVVLAGNPRALPHEIRSPEAQKYGLNKSYLQRLLELPPYSKDKDGKANRLFVTGLEKNYNPEIGN